MKTRLLTLTITLLGASLSCLGQQPTEDGNRVSVAEPTLEFRVESTPVVVVTVADEYVVLDEVTSAEFIKSLDHKNTRGIESIQVLKNSSGAFRYGLRGQDGVVIVNYKEKVNVPWELQRQFEKSRN